MFLTPRQERIFMSHVTMLDNGCWGWGGVISRGNYGKFKCSISGENKQRSAHRVAYEHWVGAIGSGLPLDHSCHTQAISRGECPGGSACRHRRCVNPDHLTPVTNRENTMLSPVTPSRINADKTHCPQGHPYDAANTYYTPVGGRVCRICRALRKRARRSRPDDRPVALPKGQQTHCPQGHPYDEENTYRPPGTPNTRLCRECNRLRSKERWERRKRAA